MAGLFLFGHGHGHSHSVPHLEEEDSDEEIDVDELKQVKCIENVNGVTDSSRQQQQPPENDHITLTEQNPLVKLAANGTEEVKLAKKRVRSNSPHKKSRCHILCMFI